MQPDALHAHLEDRLFAAAERGADPWRVGAGLLAGRLGAEPSLMAEAVWDGWAWGRAAVFAQVGPSARDPRRFEVGGPRAGGR